jgi:hypothetical protein
MTDDAIILELFSDEKRLRSIVAKYVYGIARKDTSQPLRAVMQFFDDLAMDVVATQIPIGISESVAGDVPSAYTVEDVLGQVGSYLYGHAENYEDMMQSA